MPNLLTGHRGYIGSHLIRVPSLPGAWGWIDLQDGNDYRNIRGARFETVIHLAADTSVAESVDQSRRYLENNALGLIPFLTNNNIGRFIFASTCAVYGECAQADVEDAGAKRCLSPYAHSKWLAEQIIQAVHPDSVILRLSNVCGGANPARSLHAHLLNDNPIVVYGSPTRDFVSIEAVCAELRAAMYSRPGIRNVCSGVETSVLELANLHSMERNVPLQFLPARSFEPQHVSLKNA